MMDVPALLHIYNRLTLMTREETINGRGNSDVPGTEPRPISDSQSTKEPRGMFPNPKVSCYAASFNMPGKTCTISFIEYTETDRLVFNIDKSTTQPLRDTKQEFVCDKRNLPEFMTSLFTAVKKLTIKMEMQRKGILTLLVMKINHVHCYITGEIWTCYESERLLEVTLRPGDVQPNFGEIILERCVDIHGDVGIIQERALARFNGTMPIQPIVYNPRGPGDVPPE